MKISKEFVLKEIAGNYVVLPFGENAVSFKAMITLNYTAAFLWKQLEVEKNKNELLTAMLKEYDIDRKIAEQDILEFIEQLKVNGILENYGN